MTELSNTGSYLFLAAAIIFGLGILASLAANIWLIVRAFCVGVCWGLVVFFLQPIASLVFVIVHWKVAKNPFWVGLAGLAAVLVALGLAMGGGADILKQAGAPGWLMQPAPAGEIQEEAAFPETERDRVADLLVDAGIDPANPATFKGRMIEQMIETLGKPSATMKAGREVIYIFYNCFQVVSEDGGKTVTTAHYMGK
ncbi:MAG: hypothetical protein R6X19_05050 [Kiritimatiellia bacterium]